MIFNPWRPYPLWLPKNEGWYHCTVKHGYGLNQPMTMDLFYWFAPDRGGVWIDRRRQNVFDGYKVYKSGRGTQEYNRIFTDRLCERDDVVAWKKISRPCKLFINLKGE